MAGGGPYDEHRRRLCPCRLRPLVEKEDGLHGSNVQTWWEAGGAASRAGRRAPQKAHGPSGSREPVETVGWAGERERPGLDTPRRLRGRWAPSSAGRAASAVPQALGHLQHDRRPVQLGTQRQTRPGRFPPVIPERPGRRHQNAE